MGPSAAARPRKELEEQNVPLSSDCPCGYTSPGDAVKFFGEFAKKVHESVPKPLALPDVKPEVARRVLARRAEELTWVDLQVALDGGYEEGVYYLPYALEYVAGMQSGYSELSDFVIIFVNGYSSLLAMQGFQDDAVEGLVLIFEEWLGTYSVLPAARLQKVSPAFRMGACVQDSDCMEDYLNQIMDSHDPFFGRAGEPLGACILSRWSGCTDRPTWSAHFLHMCARARRPGELELKVYTALYGSQVLKEMASSSDLILAHLPAARRCWEEHHVPGWYVELVESYLGIKS